MSKTRSSSARVRHNKWNNTPIHTIVCTNSNTSSNKKSSFETIIHHPRRLGSGSACERCRSRKTKCDGGQPCSFCATHGIQCVHRQKKKKRNSYFYGPNDTGDKLEAINVQLPSSLYRQHRNQAPDFKQRKAQSSYFDTVIQQDSIKISDASSTDSSISSNYSMHVPEEVANDKQNQLKSAALPADDPHPESWFDKRMPSMLGKERYNDQIDNISEMKKYAIF
ncbi:hypothetical protein [Parasitella parasitica]|uniref:Zn(2)-C6 fungal-type domain-containing protein n=1 Tax=Parasitella parasitica TaxID=35722 RepID=A0A0B7NJQ1_9FUNG|nr:hypothetical protein [Parasitella parasitica]